MEYTLRCAVSGDSGAVAELVGAILREYGMRIDPDGYDSDLRDVEASYIRPGGSFHVLTDEAGRVVGCVGLMRKGDGVAELRKMYLAPSVRGRGLGKRMLRAVIDEARGLGFRKVMLETASPMTAAQELYKAHGFRHVEGKGACASRCDRVYQLDLDACVHGLIPMAHVVDVDRSIRFYALLGFQVTNSLKGEAGRTQWAMMRSGRAQIMFARASGPVCADQQAVLFYLYAADIGATRECLLAAGVVDGGRYCGAPHTPDGRGMVFAPTAPGYMPRGEIRVEDPDGYCLLIGQQE